jgi:hypothetical protein
LTCTTSRINFIINIKASTYLKYLTVATMRNEMQDCHDKRAVYTKKDLFIRKLELNLREKPGRCYV